LFSPQIFSKSQNKETKLKRKETGKVLKREIERRGPKASHEKVMNIFSEEKNILTSNLLV
jgi:hypothetical protein